MLNVRFKERTNTWPGFVDLFSNLVIILIFLLIVFVFLWTTTSVFNKSSGIAVVADLKQENATKEQTIAQMSADEQEATQLLIMARSELENLNVAKNELSAELSATMASAQTQIDNLTAQLTAALADKETAQKLEQERRALQQTLDAKNAELVAELAKLNTALGAAEKKSAEQEVQYVEMSTRLNKALADKIAELNQVGQYQSEFYKQIKLALGDRTTIQQNGDRFIVSSDILFPSGAYKLSAAGREQLRLIAGVINSLEETIPTNVDWIVRVDGHTDKKKVVRGTVGYSNNTQLSLLRATAVSNELARNGVSRRRLLPSGFGELHPVELGNDAAALQKNRRIELQLTNR